MADSYLETVAGELADLALADAQANADENIVQTISEILGASSQTLQEAYLTAIRVRRAEARARELLAKRAGMPVRVKSRLLPESEKTANDSDTAIAMGQDRASEPEEPQTPQSEEDAAFADVLNTLDEFLQAEDEAKADPDAKPNVIPSRPSRS